jgi:hypothetical protein
MSIVIPTVEQMKRFHPFDRHNLAAIALFDLLKHVRLINLIATLGKLFFAISGLSYCHGFDLPGN